MLSSDVTFPIGEKPVFPDRCPVCGKGKLDGAISLKESRGVIGGLFELLWGGKVEVQIPAHQACAASYRRWRIVETVLQYAMTAVFVLLGIRFMKYFAPGVTGGFRTLAIVGIGFLPSIILGIWRAFVRPLDVDITVYRKKMDYEFRSKRYAAEFRVLNSSSIDLSDPGTVRAVQRELDRLLPEKDRG